MDRWKILVVDDNRDVRESLGDLLEAAGFEVTCADGGGSALAHLRERGAATTDAILLDFALEDMTGDEFMVAKAAHPGLARIPVLFVTADGRAPRAAAASACPCLRKPLEIDDLIASLQREIAART